MLIQSSQRKNLSLEQALESTIKIIFESEKTRIDIKACQEALDELKGVEVKRPSNIKTRNIQTIKENKKENKMIIKSPENKKLSYRQALGRLNQKDTICFYEGKTAMGRLCWNYSLHCYVLQTQSRDFKFFSEAEETLEKAIAATGLSLESMGYGDFLTLKEKDGLYSVLSCPLSLQEIVIQNGSFYDKETLREKGFPAEAQAGYRIDSNIRKQILDKIEEEKREALTSIASEACKIKKMLDSKLESLVESIFKQLEQGTEIIQLGKAEISSMRSIIAGENTLVAVVKTPDRFSQQSRREIFTRQDFLCWMSKELLSLEI